MNKKYNIVVIIFCIFLGSMLFSSCMNKGTSSTPDFIQNLFESSTPAIAATPSEVMLITSTPTLNHKTIIITPDDIFSLSVTPLRTPDSENFCERLPEPQIVNTPDELSLLSGRFVLCAWENWPWVMNTAIDLDVGKFISRDDERGDIVMQNAPGGTNEQPIFGVIGWNNAYLKDAYVLEKYANHSGTNNLSYEYCESRLQGASDTGALFVEEGKIACVKTTEGQMTLLRVEKIYPAITLSVEFSFAILRSE